MKRALSFLVLVAVIVSAFSCLTVSAASADDILGAWFGRYDGDSSGENVERYMNMTIDECDKEGNFSGTAYVTTVEGQGHDKEWVTYEFKGKYEFETGKFYMKGVKELESDSSSNWRLIPFDGLVSGDNISGLADDSDYKKFSFARVSEWAKDEITQADSLGLIPEIIRNEDLSKNISRAEFAAVAVQLYEKLTDTEVSVSGAKNFIDISGHPAETEIKQASAIDITVGVSDVEFEPNSGITREQLATMLCRTVKKYRFADWTYETDSDYYLDSEGVKKFADDYLISDYAKPSVYYMVKMGIINGIDDNRFAPRNTTKEEEANGYASATREQALAMSLRIYRLSDIWN